MKIGIVGCGPAGLATALFLTRAGHTVELIERFAEPSAIGSGFILQPTGLAVIDRLNLTTDIHALGQRLNRIYGATQPTGRVVLDVNYDALGENFHGLAVHRATLFDALFAAVNQLGISVRTGVEVQSIHTTPASATINGEANTALGGYDLVVDASGARSRLRQFSRRPSSIRPLAYGALWGTFDWPGEPFDPHVLEQRYVGAHTMAGVLPLGRHRGVDRDLVAFFWSMKTADYPDWQSQGLSRWKARVRDVWPETETILGQISDPAQMTLARYGHTTLARPYGEKLVFVGDAAHATSPQLGQGANMALLDAWALAEALSKSAPLAQQLRQYATSRRWHVRAFQLSSLAMTPFYQSDSRVLAALRDLLFNPVSKLPIARRIVAGLISGLLAGPPKELDYASGMRRPDDTH